MSIACLAWWGKESSCLLLRIYVLPPTKTKYQYLFSGGPSRWERCTGEVNGGGLQDKMYV